MSDNEKFKPENNPFLSNILDIRMDVKGGVKIKDIPFSVGLLQPKLKDNNIMITYLCKYTVDLFKEAKVPMKYTSFLIKKDKYATTSRASFVSNNDSLKTRRRRGSHYFYKLVKYAIKKNKPPTKVTDKVAIENMNHNIKFMTNMLFKPKNTIYLQRNRYLIHKIEKGDTERLMIENSGVEDINGNYERLSIISDSRPVYKNTKSKYHLFYYNGTMDGITRVAYSWYINNIYKKKLGPKEPELDYVITEIIGRDRQLRGYELGKKYDDYKNSKGWIIAKLDSIYNIKRYRKNEDSKNKDIFSKSKAYLPTMINSWFNTQGVPIFKASLKTISMDDHSKKEWIEQIHSKYSRIQIKINLYVTSKYNREKSFAKLDCADKEKILKKEFNDILGWTHTEKEKDHKKQNSQIKDGGNPTTGGTRKKKYKLTKKTLRKTRKKR